MPFSWQLVMHVTAKRLNLANRQAAEKRMYDSMFSVRLHSPILRPGIDQCRRPGQRLDAYDEEPACSRFQPIAPRRMNW
jgi:hypothetical protein